MSKIKALWNRFIDAVDDFLAYILTIVGIVFSNYIPMLKSGEPISIDVEWGRLVLAAIVAVIIIAKQEEVTPDDSGSKTRSREGRRKRFWARMFNAIAQGMAWTQLMQLGM